MSPAFQSGIEKEFPEAQLMFDQFHLMKMMNEAVDQARREEQKERPELKGRKYLYLKNEWNHTERQKELYQALRKLDLRTNKAHHLRGVFQDIFVCVPEDDESLQKRWYFWAIHSRMQPIIEFAKTVKRHWDGEVRWFTTKINNGILEGINSLIQAAKARSRGFRNVKSFNTIIYLLGAKLEFKLPKVLPSTHTK
jgi:transposase